MSDPFAALDAELCRLAVDAYTTPATIIAGGDVHAVLTRRRGRTNMSFRGTVPSSWRDWARDFAAWPIKARTHPRLGPCHDGFLTGAEAVLDQLLTVLDPADPLDIGGHSLGGALAIMVAALLVDSGLFPDRVTTFGAPRVGLRLDQVLAGVPGRRFRLGNDPVPEFPVWPYFNDRDWTLVGAPALDPFDDHAAEGYLAALTAEPVDMAHV